jgi:hypothetical protein
MSEQRADYDAIERRAANWFEYATDHQQAVTFEDIAYLLARVRRYETALREIGDCRAGAAAMRWHARAALADDAQPPAGDAG